MQDDRLKIKAIKIGDNGEVRTYAINAGLQEERMRIDTYDILQTLVTVTPHKIVGVKFSLILQTGRLIQ